MTHRFERLDSRLGRLVYRGVGWTCVLVAAICGYAAWWHVSRGLPNSWVPPAMFGVAALAAASAVPYCFSRKRTLSEAIDAMEGSNADLRRSAGRRNP